MARFHINGKGEAGTCRAKNGKCPFGGEADHYETADEAREAFEQEMGDPFDADYWDSPEGMLGRLKDGLGHEEDGELRFAALKDLINNGEVVRAQDRMIQHFKNRGRGETAYATLWPVLKSEADRERLEAKAAVPTREILDSYTAHQRVVQFMGQDGVFPEPRDAFVLSALLYEPVSADGEQVAMRPEHLTPSGERYHSKVYLEAMRAVVQRRPDLTRSMTGGDLHKMTLPDGLLADVSQGLGKATVPLAGAKESPPEDESAAVPEPRDPDHAYGPTAAKREEARVQSVQIDHAATAITNALADAAYYDDRAAASPQRRKAAKELANESRQKAERVAKELDPAMIEALKLKYLKRFKQPFDESGLSVGQLLQMAQRGELG